MTQVAAQLGIGLPVSRELASLGAALLVLLVSGLVAFLASRTLGPRLSAAWERRLGARNEGIAERMCSLLRYLTAALLLSIALAIHSWSPLAGAVLGLAAATSFALLVLNFARGLNLAGWIGAVLAGFVSVAVLARAVGGLAPITAVLDQVGFNAGERRISILTVLHVLVTLLALYAVVKLINRVLSQAIRHTHGFDPTQKLLAQKLAGVGVVVVAFFIGIDLVGIDLTALAVFSGAFGLAVGFGFQKTFGNLIAGIILLMDRSIKPGDVIVVGDSFGSVSKIGVRAVSIITRDGKEHLIPNENLMTQEVENWSYSSRDVRVHVPIGIAYDCDIVLAQKLMIEASTASKRVKSVPAPSVWLRQFGESSVDFEILVWIEDPEAGVGNVQSEILNRLWALFQENRISIPFPQRDIRVKEWPPFPAASEN
jgi:small-conductance mechanosensitive channel